jgi:hypothetical protein
MRDDHHFETILAPRQFCVNLCHAILQLNHLRGQLVAQAWPTVSTFRSTVSISRSTVSLRVCIRRPGCLSQLQVHRRLRSLWQWLRGGLCCGDGCDVTKCSANWGRACACLAGNRANFSAISCSDGLVFSAVETRAVTWPFANNACAQWDRHVCPVPVSHLRRGSELNHLELRIRRGSASGRPSSGNKQPRQRREPLHFLPIALVELLCGSPVVSDTVALLLHFARPPEFSIRWRFSYPLE